MSNTYLIAEETLDALAAEIQRLKGVAGKLSPQQQINFLTTVKTQNKRTITPGKYSSTIDAGIYLKEPLTIEGDSDLIAGNIKSGVTIFNVTGTYTGSGNNPFEQYYYTIKVNEVLDIPWPDSRVSDYFVANSHDWDAPATAYANNQRIRITGIWEGSTTFLCAYTYGSDEYYDDFIQLNITVTEPEGPVISDTDVTDWYYGEENGASSSGSYSSVTTWQYVAPVTNPPSVTNWRYGSYTGTSTMGSYSDVTTWRY